MHMQYSLSRTAIFWELNQSEQMNVAPSNIWKVFERMTRPVDLHRSLGDVWVDFTIMSNKKAACWRF